MKTIFKSGFTTTSIKKLRRERAKQSINNLFYLAWITLMSVMLTVHFTQTTTNVSATEPITEIAVKQELYVYTGSVADLNTLYQGWKYKHTLTVYIEQVRAMQRQGWSNTDILDLLAIRTVECNAWYKWDCFYRNWKEAGDVWPFQINQIHEVQYTTSWRLYRQGKFGELFLYQMRFAHGLNQDKMRRFCDWKWSITNERRFKCVARNYNGNVAIAGNGKQVRDNYKEKAWKARGIIKNYLYTNWVLKDEL